MCHAALRSEGEPSNCILQDSSYSSPYQLSELNVSDINANHADLRSAAICL